MNVGQLSLVNGVWVCDGCKTYYDGTFRNAEVETCYMRAWGRLLRFREATLWAFVREEGFERTFFMRLAEDDPRPMGTFKPWGNIWYSLAELPLNRWCASAYDPQRPNPKLP